MLKIIIISLALLFAFQHTLQAQPGEVSAQKKTELKMKRSIELLNAARKIVAEGSSKQAESLMALADAAADQGAKDYNAGEYDAAAQGLSDAVEAAVNAIMLSKDLTIRELVLVEEADARGVKDIERKEERLRKAKAEVEIFMRTAERLMAGAEGLQAEKLAEGRKLYASSVKKSASGDLDGAISEMNTAYALATSAIKEYKRSQGEIITFPKKRPADQQELITYELKKNDTYEYLASLMVKSGEQKTGGLMDAALSAREEAQRSLGSGDRQRAIERFKASTELFIQAIKVSGE